MSGERLVLNYQSFVNDFSLFCGYRLPLDGIIFPRGSLPVAIESTAYPEMLSLLMRFYPGFVLFVTGQGERTGNAAMESLLVSSPRWWGEVERWLQDVRARGHGSPFLVKIPLEESFLMVEWVALPYEEDSFCLLGRNVTLEKNLQEILTENRDRFKDFVEMVADFAWETRADGTFCYVAGGGALGYKDSELLGMRARDLIIRQPLQVTDHFESSASYEDRELVVRRKTGEAARVLISARPLFSAMGQRRGMRGICRDITEERERQTTLAHLQRRDRLVARFVRSLREAQQSQPALEMAAREVGAALMAAGCGIYTKGTQDDDFVLAAESGSALPEAVRGYTRFLRDSGKGLVHEELTNGVIMGVQTVHGNVMTGAIWVWRPAGVGGWNEIDRALLAEISDHLGIVISQFDYQERLRVLSEQDGLSRLLNRRSFMEKMEKRIREQQDGYALFYIDLDNFKAVNDTHGHLRGDMVIKKLADLLRNEAKSGDLVGRIGGDEFVLWREGLGIEAAEAQAEAMVRFAHDMKALSASPEKPLGVSVGVVVVPRDEILRTSVLMERADSAMYIAKRAGKSNWALYGREKPGRESPK